MYKMEQCFIELNGLPIGLHGINFQQHKVYKLALGGLIGINKTIKQFNPLSDLNDINGVGFSGYGLSVMNTPTGRYGTVFQLSNKAEAISGEAGSWLYQFCFETESNRILYRKRINDIDWGDWFEIVLKSI